jgi:hypothetical protein
MSALGTRLMHRICSPLYASIAAQHIMHNRHIKLTYRCRKVEQVAEEADHLRTVFDRHLGRERR